MPNYITNKITILNTTKQKEIVSLLKILNENLEFDFNQYSPIPESLNITCGTYTDIGYSLLSKTMPEFTLEKNYEEWKNKTLKLKHVQKNMDEIMSLGKIAFSNKEKYGHTTWYPYCLEHWGTKWNSNAIDISGIKCKTKNRRIFKKKMQDKENIFLKFITASSTPFPIFQKIGIMFPNTTFKIEFADENIGSSNCGIITITNKNINVLQPKNMSIKEEDIKWSKFAFELLHPNTDRRSYGFNHNWEYSDETAEAYEKEQINKEKIKFKLKQL